eukprot:g8216.t1
MRPSAETEELISQHLSPQKKAGDTAVADAKIEKRMGRLVRNPRIGHLAESKPLLKAIETWGSWLDVGSNVHVVKSRALPAPASTPDLVLVKPDIFKNFDAASVPRRRKGHRFKGSFQSLNQRNPVNVVNKSMPPIVGPGRYNTHELGAIDPKREKEPLTKFRLASSIGFTQDTRWKTRTGFDWRPGPGAYGVPYVSLFPDPETETRPWRPRGTVFGPDKSIAAGDGHGGLYGGDRGKKTRFGRTETLAALEDSRAKILQIEEAFKE